MVWIRRSLGAAVASAVAVAGMAGIVPGKASASSPVAAVGVQFHAMWSDYTDAQRLALLDKMAAANIRWVRIDLGWSAFEEAGKGQYSSSQLARFDMLVNAANARGVNILGTLWRSPGWANGNQSANTPPTNAADFGNFAGFMANRYKGRVPAWEIWNEPNSSSFMTGADPAKYASLVKAAYPAIKAADPAATVVMGALQKNDDPWLAKVYDNGVRGFYDVLSVHPYQGPSNAAPEIIDDGHIWLLDHVGAVRNLMVARGDGDKKIWATELGWSSHSNTGSEPSWKLGVTAAQQADYSVRVLQWFAARHSYITNVFFYNERNKVTGDAQEDNYGILNRDLSDKPVYTALKTLLGGTGTVDGGGSTTTTTAPAPTTTTTAPAPTTTTTAPSTTTSTTTTKTTTTKKKGYRLVSSDGRIFSYSAAGAGGISTYPVAPGQRIVASTGNADGTGSWSVTDRGAVFATGSAPHLGGVDHLPLNKPIVGMAATPTGKGYWMVATDGGVFSFGDAKFFGSTGGIALNKPIVGMAATPSGRGYWMVASDGGIFAFGDAKFFGSTGSLRLNQPIVGMASAANGNGYWMVAADGGIFAYNVPFLGSTGSIRLNRPIVGMVSTSSGNGYWFAAADGGIFAYGDAEFLGSAADTGATFTTMAPA